MIVRVKLFAAYREAAGWDDRELEIESGDTTGTVWETVCGDLSSITPRTPLCAVNQRHTSLDASLEEGDELAFFPPVSGGEDDSDPIWSDPSRLIVTDAIDVATLERELVTDQCGAVCTFLGIVRDHHEGQGVEAVSYEAYPEMAGAELARLCREAEQSWPGVRAVVVHRTGRLEIGEASVAILAAAPHRAESFEAARFLIEEIKKSVPIWKKDHYRDGEESWRDK